MNMDIDMDGKFHIHGKPGQKHEPLNFTACNFRNIDHIEINFWHKSMLFHSQHNLLIYLSQLWKT